MDGITESPSGGSPPPLDDEVRTWREWLRRPAGDPLHKSAVRRLTRAGLLPHPAEPAPPSPAAIAAAELAEGHPPGPQPGHPSPYRGPRIGQHPANTRVTRPAPRGARGEDPRGATPGPET